ncbi:hypothetical protein [Ligilactobacillus salivarius]|uniref:hypothetical protein n=1 Tax=Ligilactobacillus salivarius TaxID=1624 RepID=UPI001CDBAFEE|nr:hypothetical protein [Ligilactobacillus salivarius]
MRKIIVINSGSSSLKFKLFESPSKNVLASGLIERIGLDDSIITIKYGDKKKHREVQAIKDHTVAVDLLLQLLKKLDIVTDLNEISAVGHRVVAGGEYFKKSVPVDGNVIKKIEDIIELAPLHNPANLVGIKVFKKLLPNALSVVAFDTAFIAASGIDENGVYLLDQGDAEIVGLAVSRARKVILVAEHQKFVNKSYYRICPLDKISMFITDKALTPEQRAMFTDKTEIIVAN